MSAWPFSGMAREFAAIFNRFLVRTNEAEGPSVPLVSLELRDAIPSTAVVSVVDGWLLQDR